MGRGPPAVGGRAPSLHRVALRPPMPPRPPRGPAGRADTSAREHAAAGADGRPRALRGDGRSALPLAGELLRRAAAAHAHVCLRRLVHRRVLDRAQPARRACGAGRGHDAGVVLDAQHDAPVARPAANGGGGGRGAGYYWNGSSWVAKNSGEGGQGGSGGSGGGTNAGTGGTGGNGGAGGNYESNGGDGDTGNTGANGGGEQQGCGSNGSMSGQGGKSGGGKGSGASRHSTSNGANLNLT